MSVTEGTTRIFDTPPIASDPFANLNDWAGPLDKPNTNPIVIPTGKETQILSNPESKSNTKLIIGGIIGFVSVVIFALALSYVFMRFSSTNAPIAPAQPEVPIVQQPPAPPAPPQPPTTADLSKLIYPNAKTVMQLGNGSMILSTGDSVEKVAKWYTGKLNPSSDIKTPESRIIASEKGISAIIAREGNSTKIILAQGDDSH